MRMLLENLLDIYQGKSLLVICFIVSTIYIVCVIKETTLRRNLIVAAFAIIFVFNNIALCRCRIIHDRIMEGSDGGEYIV